MTARDLAQYILNVTGKPMSTMKLQKLTFYSQAFHCAMLGAPIFNEPIVAWRMGPVCRDLYDAHKGQYTVTTILGGAPGRLLASHKAAADVVIKAYGGLSGKQLSDMTHSESPWIDAFDGDDDFPNGLITPDVLGSYYRTKWLQKPER